MIKLAIADDHPAIREGLNAMLVKMGFEILMLAEDGADLVQKLSEAPQLPDICIMDINMPNLDGFKATEILKERWPEIKVLVVTVHNEDRYFIRMVKCGACGYLYKSARAEQYREAIMNVHQLGLHFSDAEMRNFIRSIKNEEIAPVQLTPIEEQIVKLCCAELTTIQIADKLGKTVKAIENIKKSIYLKLGVSSSAGLAIAAVKHGYYLVHKPQ